MKKSALFTLLALGLMFTLVIGCEVVTENPPSPIYSPAHNVVINELFLLPPTNPNYFFWIEFYNPTSSLVQMSGWTLGLTTTQIYIAYDSTGFIRGAGGDTIPTYHDVPLKVLRNHPLSPNGFQTIVSDIDRMQNYTGWVGSTDPLVQGTTLFLEPDTVRVDSIVQVLFTFALNQSDQLVLKDSLGTVVDVVRYGNYTYSGGTDPFPNNHSLGPIVPFQSYARFAGAYTSGPNGNAAAGNSANDFFVTGVAPFATTVPTPQWINQGYKY
jgi:Lamin Tail Domain